MHEHCHADCIQSSLDENQRQQMIMGAFCIRKSVNIGGHVENEASTFQVLHPFILELPSV